ncbi:2Fe-2S iron-sulfur cluster-binding protein [Alcaligenes sp. SDU_A2]|uniref:2Fe-2S iron-sulfur cluster-binding protein n=1 Tax=Alcaligenes sp. SDU_A2 TaxID=3136634 RepID=UPI0031203B36
MKVFIVEATGLERTLEVESGMSVMESAVRAGVEGIDADCGGSCSCATCHVYVDPSWLERLPQMQAMERDMLGFAQGRQANSRLSCQLMACAELDGMRLSIPVEHAE